MADYAKKFVTEYARLCFPAFDEPKSFDEGQPGKYGCLLVFPKGTDLSQLKAEIKAAYDKEFSSGTRNVTSPIRDGNAKAEEWGVAFKDAHFIRVSTKMKPPLYDREGKRLMSGESFYSGCWVRAEIHAVAYNKLGNKGVALYLDGVKFEDDGPRIGTDHAAATQKALMNAPSKPIPPVSEEEGNSPDNDGAWL